MSKSKFTFVDLFAGIGGFHAALGAMGGKCVYAVEVDRVAARVYEQNWGIDPLGDITVDTESDPIRVPPHDVLVAGFPCQPFSKSGAQRGMDETRGTLYWNILRIIETHHPALVLLENVRNLAGPRHVHEWAVIISTLRDQGYRVSDEPTVFSPHLLPPELGGRPQVRERVFIAATFDPVGTSKGELSAAPLMPHKPVGDWDPKNWILAKHLPLERRRRLPECELTESETLWIDAWDEFVRHFHSGGKRRLPGFPIWADHWVPLTELKIPRGTPDWKADFLKKNAQFYSEHAKWLDRWTERWGLYTEAFPASRRKLEWQAQDLPGLWDCVMHFRPSGIRAKAPTYLPALVAITQTSIIGPKRRRLSVREAARLQGLPDWFDFSGQGDAASYRQLGNGVSVGAVWYVLKKHAERDAEILKRTSPQLLRAIEKAPNSPDLV